MGMLSCCKVCDRVGCLPESWRSCILGLDLVLMTAALVLSIIGLLGVSSSEDILAAVPWIRVKSSEDYPPLAGDATLYFNLWGGLIKLGSQPYCNYFVNTAVGVVAVDVCKGLSWDDLTTGNEELRGFFGVTNETNYFADCKDASQGCISLAIIGVVGAVVALISRAACNSRFSYDRDTGKKCIILITTLIPVVTSIGELSNFAQNCIHQINDAIDAVPRSASQGTLLYGSDATLGAGFIAIVASLICNILSFILQLFVPGNKAGDKQNCEQDKGKPQFTNTVEVGTVVP